MTTTMSDAVKLVRKMFDVAENKAGKGEVVLHCATGYMDLAAYRKLVTEVFYKGVNTGLVEYDGKLWKPYNPCAYGLSVMFLGKLNS